MLSFIWGKQVKHNIAEMNKINYEEEIELIKVS